MADDITPRDLELRLGTSTYVSVFADSGTDIVNIDAVNAVLRAAKADVARYRARGYDGSDEVLSDVLWSLQLDFAAARALMRGDAYTRDMGERLLTTARETGEAIAEGLQRGSITQPNPTSAVSPATDASGSYGAGPLRFDEGCITEEGCCPGFYRQREKC